MGWTEHLSGKKNAMTLVQPNLHKHLVANRSLRRLGRGAVDRHRLPVTRELQCELLLHQLFDHL